MHTAEQIRRLSPEEAERHYPVRLRGVITFYDAAQFFRFVQDETAGIYFYLTEDSTSPTLAAGQWVELRGETGKGEYAPVINVRLARVDGQANLPLARPVSFEQLASGQQDSQFVEVQGITRAVRYDERSRYFQVQVATGGGRVTALAARLPVERGEDLLGSTVRLRGVCVSRFNLQRQLFDVRLLVPRPEDLIVETPAPTDPFGIQAQSIASLLQFSPQGPLGHRVKVSGTVTSRPDEGTLYLQDQTEGLLVETIQAGALQPGDQVEVLGFPARGEYNPMLQDAIFRKIGSRAPPSPDAISADEALKGTHDCRLTRLEATLLDRVLHSREQFLVLQAGGFVFHAYLPNQAGGTGLLYLQQGSQLAVTGICRIERISEWHVGTDWRATAFRLLLRSPADVVVLRAPSWWTLQRLLWTVGMLGVLVLAAFAWVGVLRRRVQRQTEIIGQKLQAEAALKERYLELFENANDMVYTHDLNGRLTTVNHSGEQLLQRRREEILAQNLVDLIVPEQQAAAQQWVEEVIHGAGPPTAEWDFRVPAGSPLTLEISARLIEQNGRPAEVEGMARDITERKRLEREILEISNREQRRIGHDLHDGVCQQLAGIAYLTESLADRLTERTAPEGAELERIHQLLNTAISQTRGVARGLFPVRLEEDGLVSALEELAATASSLFSTTCRFNARQPPDRVDNTIALHVYFIAQEAVTNAARHAKAKSIEITLEPQKNRFALCIRDDGTGFVPLGQHHTGMGLRIMHYRARVIGASLEVKSQPGVGTTVTCTFNPCFPASK